MNKQKPRLESYDVRVLFSLLDNTYDDETQEKIKRIIINKINNNKYPLFYYINKFKTSIGDIKEIYADLILMNLDNDTINLVTDEILQHASHDALIHYGASYGDSNLTKRCKEEFYSRCSMIEEPVQITSKKKSKRKVSFVVVK